MKFLLSVIVVLLLLIVLWPILSAPILAISHLGA